MPRGEGGKGLGGETPHGMELLHFPSSPKGERPRTARAEPRGHLLDGVQLRRRTCDGRVSLHGGRGLGFGIPGKGLELSLRGQGLNVSLGGGA